MDVMEFKKHIGFEEEIKWKKKEMKQWQKQR